MRHSKEGGGQAGNYDEQRIVSTSRLTSVYHTFLLANLQQGTSSKRMLKRTILVRIEAIVYTAQRIVMPTRKNEKVAKNWGSVNPSDGLPDGE